jgi:hypothetical protein
MKKFLFVSMMVLVAFIMACASQQMASSGSADGQPAKEKKRVRGATIGTVCFTPDADTDFFACNGIVQATESTEGQALRQALIQAQSKCAQKAQHAVQGLAREYENNYTSVRGTDIAAKLQDGYDHIIKKILDDTKENCQQTDEFEDDNGRYRVYVGIKISRQKIASELKKATPNMLTEEEKRKLDFQEDQFNKLIDKKLQDYQTESAEKQAQYNEEHVEPVKE